MRTIKTAVAVLVCFLIFLPLWTYVPVGADDPLQLLGPFNACIAAIICMQSSVEQTLQQGLFRVVGTVLGGLVGLGLLLLDDLVRQPVVTGLLLAGGVVLTLWLCNAIKRPGACSIACVVLCGILLNHGGEDRYLYVLFRVLETTAGILVAAAVNRALPDHRDNKGE